MAGAEGEEKGGRAPAQAACTKGLLLGVWLAGL